MNSFFNRDTPFYFFLIIFFTGIAKPQSNDVSVLNPKTRDYNQKNVKLFLQFDADKNEVIGKEEFTFSPLKNNFDSLIFDAKTIKVSSVKLNGVNLSFSQTKQNVFIKLDKNYNAGDSITVQIDYTAFPTDGLFFFKPSKEFPTMRYNIWSQGEDTGNRYWYLAYDLPDDKLTSEIITTVPDSLTVISNGDLVFVNENENDRTKTFDWKCDVPHANYLTSIIIGDYVTLKDFVRGVELDYNVPREWADKTDYFYGRTPQMIEFYSDYVAPYPYNRYAQTTVQDFEYGGMENITATTLNMRLLEGKSAIPNYKPDDLTAHELAHQWFGDLLTCKTFGHIWLNESFATYFTDLYYLHQFGKDEFKFLRYSENRLYLTEEVKEQPLDSIKAYQHNFIPVELGETANKCYERGAAVLNMLRYELGDKAFKKGIQHYVQKFKYDDVTTEDFKKAMEESTGKDLSWFFNEWVYGAGYPEFKVSYKYDVQNKKVLLTVEQTQKELPAVGVFDLYVPVEITAGKNLISEKIHITKRDETFEFNCPGKPDMVLFNKNIPDLCTVDFSKSFNELAYQLLYDDDIIGRIDAADSLASFGEKAIPLLKRTLMRDDFYGVRMHAAESLKKIGGENAFGAIMLAANDFDARVQEEAIKGLSMYPKKSVEDFLKKELFNSENDYVKGAAAYAIGAGKMPGAFDILKRALTFNSHRNIIRRYAFDGLKALGDPRAIQLADEYSNYKYSIGGMHLVDIAALDCAKSFINKYRKEVIKVYNDALQNYYWRTRIYASKLLVEADAKESLPLLKKIADEEQRKIAKPELKEAVKKLE
ncbi:MAG: M1 family aminopeptidase [Ignavibacteriaceae bacterium]